MVSPFNEVLPFNLGEPQHLQPRLHGHLPLAHSTRIVDLLGLYGVYSIRM